MCGKLLNLGGEEADKSCKAESYSSLLLSLPWNDEGEAEEVGELNVEGDCDCEKPATLSLKSLINEFHFIVLFLINLLSHPIKTQDNHKY